MKRLKGEVRIGDNYVEKEVAMIAKEVDLSKMDMYPSSFEDRKNEDGMVIKARIARKEE